MGGSGSGSGSGSRNYVNRQNVRKSSSFSVFNFFKSAGGSSIRRTARRTAAADEFYGSSWDEATSGRKVWPSDEDKGGRWVADPRIDTKASAFIAHFHASRFSEPERQIFHQAAAAAAAAGN